MHHQTLDDLLHQLDHADLSVRMNAVFTLGEQRAQEAVPMLIALLDNANTIKSPMYVEDFQVLSLASSAAIALGKIGDPRAIPSLVAAYEQGMFSALKGLACFPDDMAFMVLLRAFEQAQHPHVATLLGRRGDRRAVPALIVAMDNPTILVRFYTVRALGRLGDPRAIAALEAVTDDQRIVKHNKTIAQAVQTALAQIKAQHSLDS
ncbi:HEAT repeat domain-containing protein [Herpetosiphon giganteus]|uniref:HEAT repeat domain-containing protein n=1 Tax=Herpetosiphon giganteus TaxID=2029754 RepID=UPI00195E7EB1|nr:HEAT repeat domain-containing protein [Herpetosiphon giganteus]MBM7846660.1 HEAT repeat protein [Herpetosiphon giganteus]